MASPTTASATASVGSAGGEAAAMAER
jgi:hypothetical protein